MATIFRGFLISALAPAPSASSRTSASKSRRGARIACSASSGMDAEDEGRRRFMEFPYMSAPVRNMMVDLVSTMESRLHSQLLPSNLPPDMQYFRKPDGTAAGSLRVRSGSRSSLIDFILGSWFHSELPTGGALSIASLSAYLTALTDAPNFVVELLYQSSPASMVLILDLPPRQDLALNPNYVKTFYEDTQLDTRRQMLEKIPEVRPYVSPNLYLRCIFSPAAIVVRIETEDMDEIFQNCVHPIAKEMLGIWLDKCACAERRVGEADRAYLVKRDRFTRSKTVELDLGSSLPRLFGPEIAERVTKTIREADSASSGGL